MTECAAGKKKCAFFETTLALLLNGTFGKYTQVVYDVFQEFLPSSSSVRSEP